MKKTAIIAVSTGCLDYLELDHENLFIIRCKIIMKDKTYNDFTEIKASTFYQTIKSDSSVVPTSSMPALGEINETLETIEQAGYENALFVTISSELSGTFQTCVMAKNAYEGKLNIEVLDSKNAAISEGYLTLEALRLVKEDHDMAEIITYLNKLSTSRKQYFMVDNLRLLVKNGRLSGAKGFMGRMLKMKPILEVNEDGKIVPFEKIRTQKKALERMVDLVLEDLKDIENFVITYNTSDNEEGFKYVKDRIDQAHPNNVNYAAPITPVIGAHTGHGTVGIAYFNLDNLKK